jgi:hypothetical protein
MIHVVIMTDSREHEICSRLFRMDTEVNIVRQGVSRAVYRHGFSVFDDNRPSYCHYVPNVVQIARIDFRVRDNDTNNQDINESG